jgi:hypothetical protein
MRINKRLIFKKPDGSVAISSPALPLSGSYKVGEYLLHTNTLSERLIAVLDAKVNDGSATFTQEETEDDYLNRVESRIRESQSIPPEWVRVAVVSPEDLPPERSLRDSWTHDGNVVCHDLPKAKEIWKNKLRRQRTKRFVELDGQRFVAMRKNLSTVEIDKEAQRLADITDLVDQAIDIESIKSITCDSGI